MCAAQHLKRYHDPEDLCGKEWELNDEEIAALDLQGAASPMEVEGELPDMNAEEMAKEGFYLVKSVLRHRYRQGWRFLTLWEGFGVEEATWEPFSAFVLPEGRLNSVPVFFLGMAVPRPSLHKSAQLRGSSKDSRYLQQNREVFSKEGPYQDQPPLCPFRL